MRISDWSSDVCSSDLDADFNCLQIIRRCDFVMNYAAWDIFEITRFYTYFGPILKNQIGPAFQAIIYLGLARMVMPPSWLAHGLPYGHGHRSEEHTSELQSLMRLSYAVFCLIKQNHLHQ